MRIGSEEKSQEKARDRETSSKRERKKDEQDKKE